jgi:hypothetical protein
MKVIQGSRRVLARQDEEYPRHVSRWITLEPPSVVLNAPNVAKTKMTRSPVVPWDKSAHEMLKEYVQSGDKHLVFNCHGYASRENFGTAHLSIGTVIHLGNVSAFSQLDSFGLKVIWISACNLLGGAGAVPGGPSAGEEFCKNMAKNAGCYVVAPTMAVTQNVKAHHVEDTAGAMWKYFAPDGSYVGRLAFIKLGPQLGFEYEKK